MLCCLIKQHQETADVSTSLSDTFLWWQQQIYNNLRNNEQIKNSLKTWNDDPVILVSNNKIAVKSEKNGGSSILVAHNRVTQNLHPDCGVGDGQSH